MAPTANKGVVGLVAVAAAAITVLIVAAATVALVAAAMLASPRDAPRGIRTRPGVVESTTPAQTSRDRTPTPTTW